MTKEEAQKINELYKQIDALTVENTTLKDVQTNTNVDSNLLVKLESVENKLDKLLSKTK